MVERIAVYGADHNIGTSMFVQSLAEILVSAGEKILFIDASDSMFEGYTGKKFNCPGIDMIGSRLTTQQAILSVGDSFDVILGVRGLAHKGYPEGFFSQILNKIEDGYSRVIIDAGADFRSSLCKEALKYADKRIFLLRQNPKCIEKFKTATNNVFDPIGAFQSQDVFVINALRKSKMLYSKEQLEAEILRNTYTLPYIRTGLSCEFKKKSLASVFKPYRKAVENIIKQEL